jgi:hypothetical protein
MGIVNIQMGMTTWANNAHSSDSDGNQQPIV